MNRARSPRLVIGIGAAVAVVAVIVGISVARSGDDRATPPTTVAVTSSTSAAPGTSATPTAGTLPPTVATVARPSTTVATTTTVVTTTTSVAATTTTTAAPVTVAAPATTTTTIDPDAVPAYPCEAADLLAAFRVAQPAPDGTRIDGVRCYGLYAAGVVSTNGANRAFAVFGAGDTGWRLLNVGTAFVCQPLEITDPAYTTIGCPAWDI